MGPFEVELRVSPLVGGAPGAWETVRLLVDTGATDTTIPEAVLNRMGVARLGHVPIRLADGTTQSKDYGWALIEVEGRVVPGIVLFGRPNDFALLGATTMEQASVGVDPSNRRLIATTAIQA